MSYSTRQIRKIMPVVKQIEKLENEMYKLPPFAFPQRTIALQKKIKDGVALDKLLPEAYALVREASRRVLGLFPYEVQLIGGVLLYQGRIAEMCTGEGKTLVAALPSYLMALTGKGVHVVTVNDYLAQRDAEEIGRIHQYLGLTVGCILADMSSEERKAAYQCDITYVTNHELGFDYLRDNMASDLDKQVQRGLHYCIIDEVDSILIDEARTPLIISGQGKSELDLYIRSHMLAKRMIMGESSGELSKLELMSGKDVVETGDFIVEEKDKLVHLTESGVEKVESFFGIQNYSDVKNLEIQHHVMLALKAHYIMHKDVDYVVKDGEIFIVDEFTGRMMQGRRYSDGLHQAIEAKEGVEIRQESRTLATITFQNFFNLYERKAGMTGTAMTESQEFWDIYAMDVVSVPTNRPIQRVDMEDAVYLTKRAKYDAVIHAIMKAHERHQPVLVGTVSIEVSEYLSRELYLRNVQHQVLNAKHHEQEAEIIASAGEAGFVTIATNMAGRGTDIKLDDDARAAGGLFVIGTERHESRRIDNQLRGRAGRQGDPGRSKFYLSLEDDLLRLFGSDGMMEKFRNMGMTEHDRISHKLLGKAIETAQKKIEGNHFGARKQLMQFDEVNHQQRAWVYSIRQQILEKQSVDDFVHTFLDYMAGYLVNMYCDGTSDTWDMEGFSKAYQDLIPQMRQVTLKESMTLEKFSQVIRLDMEHWLSEKTKELSAAIMDDVKRTVLLRTMDTRWMQQLEDLEQTRQAVSMIGYGQKDPVIEYKMRAFALFQQMQLDIARTSCTMLYHAHIVENS